MQSDQPEQQWIRDFHRGDLDALEKLVEHFRRPLFAFILHTMPRHGDAEEIFQEVWLRAIKHLPRYREKNFAGWIFRIARNFILDQIRRESRYVPPPEDDPAWINRFPDRQPTPDQQAGNAELGLRIQSAIASLSPEQREVFLLRNEAGLSFKEIARLQATSLNTALSRMHYAVQKLRPLLANDYPQGKE